MNGDNNEISDQEKDNNVDTNFISTIISNSIVHNTTLTKSDEEKTREEYLKIIERQNWKELLVDINTKILSNLDLENDDGSNSYTIETQLKTYDLNNKIITIGRFIGCDVYLGHDSCSRLHAIVFIQKNNIIVVDMTSFHGTITKIRSSDKDKQHSVPKSRQPLVFDKNERFVLHIGEEEVSFNPKLCIACLDKPRQMLADCGHFTLCKKCYKTIKDINNKCPICRRIMMRVKTCNHFKTNCGWTQK